MGIKWIGSSTCKPKHIPSSSIRNDPDIDMDDSTVIRVDIDCKRSTSEQSNRQIARYPEHELICIVIILIINIIILNNLILILYMLCAGCSMAAAGN